MPRYRLDFLASLARQMAFVPAGIREKQLQAAESLLLSIDPGKGYPPQYVIFRVTDFRPATPPADLVTGIALQHDLGLLIEEVSDTLAGRTADRDEPVLTIDDLVARFNVTSKTIQRWRRRGLAARRFVFPDGKRRVGFRLAVVDQFLTAYVPDLRSSATVGGLTAAERAEMIRHARRLAMDPRRPVDEIARRAGRRINRSPLAVEAELRQHDAGHPAAAVLTGCRPAVPRHTAAAVHELSVAGLSLESIAARLDLPRSTACRLMLAGRLDRIVKRPIKYHDDPLYHQPDAERVLEHLLTQNPIAEVDGSLPPMREVSPDLRALCEHPVFSPTQERAMFLLYNFRKYQAATARRRLDPARVGRRSLARIEGLVARAGELRNRIVRANLRLVVSVAKKHVRPTLSLGELVNEGSLTLMRAVEGFDTRRGHKFSTYATLALMKGFARTAGRATGRGGMGPAAFAEQVADRSNCGFARVDLRDRIEALLAPLDVGERAAVRRHFGLDVTAGEPDGTCDRLRRLGLSKLRATGQN